MEVVKCSRCGAFYTQKGNVCPKCTNKDNFELETFKSFVEENGIELKTLNQVSALTGITEKNLNRFLTYKGLEGYKKLFK